MESPSFRRLALRRAGLTSPGVSVHGQIQASLFQKVLVHVLAHGHGLSNGDGARRARRLAIPAAEAGFLVHNRLSIACAKLQGILRADGLGAFLAPDTHIVVNSGGEARGSESTTNVAGRRFA